jgi:hypothetical protein
MRDIFNGRRVQLLEERMSDGYEDECLSCGFSATDMRRWKWRAEEQRDKNKELEQRIAELEAWVRLAPHSATCPTHQSFIVDDGPGNRPRRVVPECTCWKAQALEKDNEQ